MTSGPFSTPALPGWYPDPSQAGTRYWDGDEWTAYYRPPRRSFAPAHSLMPLGICLLALSILFPFVGIMASIETGTYGSLIAAPIIFIVGVIGSIYLMRGKGPSTAEVEAELAAKKKAAAKKRFTANMWGIAASLTRRGPAAPAQNSNGILGDTSAAAAQVNAVASPDTAQALQKLQNLLYTRTITDAEFNAAKDKLFGAASANSAVEQLKQLAELHEDGILSDIDFANAKTRLLG